MRTSRTSIAGLAVLTVLVLPTACSSPNNSTTRATASSGTATVLVSPSTSAATGQPTRPSVDATPVNDVNPCDVLNIAHVDTITGVKGWPMEYVGADSNNPASGFAYSTSDHRTCFYVNDKTHVVTAMVETYVADGDVKASYDSATNSVSGTAGDNQYETIHPISSSNLKGVTQLAHASRVSPVTKVAMSDPSATIIRLNGMTFVAWFQDPQTRTTFASVDYALYELLQNEQKHGTLN